MSDERFGDQGPIEGLEAQARARKAHGTARHRVRRGLVLASVGVAGATGLGLGLGMGPSGGHRSSSSAGAGDARHGGTHAMVLGTFTFPMLPGFHPTTASIGACRRLASFRERVTLLTRGAPSFASATGIARNPVKIAAAKSGDDRCVEMALTDAFTSGATTNPYLYFSASSMRQVKVAGYPAWLTPTGDRGDRPTPEVVVEIPQATGQFRYLAVGAAGIGANRLLAIVSRGLGPSPGSPLGLAVPTPQMAFFEAHQQAAAAAAAAAAAEGR